MPLANIDARRQYDRERARKRYQERAKKRPRQSKICIECGASFTGSGYKYCSDECAEKAHRRQRTAKQREYNKRRPQRGREWYLANRDAYWVHGLKKTHGITPEQWHAMFMEQRGCCYLCEQQLPDNRSRIAIDHDHSHCGPSRSCGVCRRGLAHSDCNTGVGLFGEDPDRMRRAADNLARAQAITRALILAAPSQTPLF